MEDGRGRSGVEEPMRRDTHGLRRKGPATAVEPIGDIVASEIDTLYQEAVFLNAGAGDAAEDLLFRTVSGSVEAYGAAAERDSVSTGRWMEGRMVLEFLSAFGRATDDPDPVDRPPSPAELPPRPRTGSVGDLDVTAVYRAAALLPPIPRAALWLVIFGGWSYADSAALLDRPQEELVDLLRYRHVFASEVLRRSDGASADDRAV